LDQEAHICPRRELNDLAPLRRASRLLEKVLAMLGQLRLIFLFQDSRSIPVSMWKLGIQKATYV